MDNPRLYQDFQDAVQEYLIRHRSILDVLSKLQEYSARTQRAVIKAVTTCGCLQVDAYKSSIPPDTSYLDLKNHMDTHLRGQLCETCRDIIETEIGQQLFYLAALCNSVDLDLNEICKQQGERIATLGKFYLT